MSSTMKKSKAGSKANGSKGSKKPEEQKEDNRIELSAKRFVSVSEFKGAVRVDIREYFEKDGKLLPGKKGINISVPEWQKLRDQFDEIEALIKKMGGEPEAAAKDSDSDSDEGKDKDE